MTKNLSSKARRKHLMEFNMYNVIGKRNMNNLEVYQIAKYLLERYREAFIELAKK